MRWFSASSGLIGEEECEDCARRSLGAASDSQPTTVTLDDLLTDPETEASACSDLGGKKGLEDEAEVSAVDSGYVSATVKGRPLRSVRQSVASRARSSMRASFRIRRVDGVDDQITQDLADFTFKAGNRASHLQPTFNKNACVH